MKFILFAVLLVYIAPAALAVAFWWGGQHPASWRDADWTSARLLPSAAADRAASVYVFAARTGGLKGALSEHSWIVVKDRDGASYERWDKVGWGMPIRRNAYPPDGRWYSNAPRLVLERHGPEAETIIAPIRQAIASYPYAMRGGYHLFPGPNSNTFVEYVLRSVPGLRTILPPAAVGRDFPSNGSLLNWDPDRRDLRASLFGYAGLSIGATAGFEVNLLGLVAGIDPMKVAVKIPAFGTFSLNPFRAGA